MYIYTYINVSIFIYDCVYRTVCVDSTALEYYSASRHPQVVLQVLHEVRASLGLSSHERCGARQEDENKFFPVLSEYVMLFSLFA